MGYNALKKRGQSIIVSNCFWHMIVSIHVNYIPKIKSSRQYLDNNNFSTSTSIHDQSQTYKTLWNEEISSKCWQILTPLRSLFFILAAKHTVLVELKTSIIKCHHYGIRSCTLEKSYPVEVYPCIRVRVLLENSYPGTSSLREPATQRT